MSDEYRRQREFPYPESLGVYTSTGKSDPRFDGRTEYRIWPVGVQTTWSRDTQFHAAKRAEASLRSRAIDADSSQRAKWWSERDLGSNFMTVRRTYSDNGCSTARYSGYRDWIGAYLRYSGPIMALNPSGPSNSWWPPYNNADLTSQMLKWGTTAIANTIPTNPSVGVGQLIGESMERLPRLPGAAILGRPGRVSKKFADEYLNYEFGLKPLINDVQGIAQTVKDTNRILAQLERDSGRLVRRRYSAPVERKVEVVVTPSQYPYPAMNAAIHGPSQTRTRTRTTETRMWFSGAYTYYYAQGDNLSARLRRSEQAANRLFGLRLDPSLIWELSPWSWAADWVTNAGDVLRNISAFSRDGLVLRWGYVMCTQTITDTYTLPWSLMGGSSGIAEQSFTTTVKKRLKATPYGFGLDPNWSDLSSRQLAILGALGISRVG